MDSEKRDKAVDIPYIAFESVTARWERANKRLIVVIGILIGLLFASNAIWIWSLYGTDFESYESDVDSQGGNVNYAYAGNDMKGDLTYGAGESESAENNAQRCDKKDNENTGQNG